MLGGEPAGLTRAREYGEDAWEALDAEPAGERIDDDELERRRIEARGAGAGAASSTTASCLPRPGSSSGRSA